MPEVAVGLGSNIDPVEHLRRALHDLERAFGPVRDSQVYRSRAVGLEGPDFLNMVVQFASEEPAEAIEALLTALEADSGRLRSKRLASRTLDLDLLYYGNRVDPQQRLPREDILQYAFVLGPLNELEPARVHPVTGQTMAQAWRQMCRQGGQPALTPLGYVREL